MTSTELANYLVTKSYGTLNVNIFYDEVPPDPDTLIAVLEYDGGEPDEPNLGTGGTLTRLEFPRIQVLTRGAKLDNDGPKLKLIQIRATLVAVLNQVISGVKYVGIEALGPPRYLDKDVNFRRIWVCNFRIIKEPSVS